MSGLQIQKLLPKTNCKECGSNTCLAFAMRLAAKKASLSECPYASDEAKAVLGADSEPPVKGVAVGGDTVGEETVLYRHEKTFIHQTLFAININDTDAGADAAATLEKIRDYKLERVGETLTVAAIAITQTQADAGAFLKLAEEAVNIAAKPLIIRALDAVAAGKAASLAKGTGGVIAGVTEENADAMRAIAEENGLVLAVAAQDVDGTAALTSRLKDAGFNNLLIEFRTHSAAEAFQTNSIARRAAIKSGVKSLGYATLSYIDSGDLMDDTVLAVTEINKYGGVCVLPRFDAAQLVCLMALRQNIYTDPQKPIQVEPKVYAIGEPGRESPVFVTTNFSLTYFLVSGEIENTGISAWLIIPECEGMSVLTSWAAGKFSGASIAKFIKEIGFEETVDTRTIIIPGYVSQISGELEENLPGWKVLVGPQEAADIEAFVKAFVK
jgi:acetyl-CoA decarbonylase/synthase complex subunit gamma